MRRFSACILALILALGCPKEEKPTPAPAEPPAPAQPQERRESEPNDTVTTGLAVETDVRVSGELSAGGKKPDEDIFRLVARGEAMVADFSVEGSPGLDLALELLDQDGNHLAVFNSEGEGKSERIARVGLGVPCAVKVYAANKGGAGAYVATVRFLETPPGSEREPNDRAVDATPLVLGAPVQGWIGDRADEDWYRIEVAVPPLPGATDGQEAGAAAPDDRANAAPAPVAAEEPDASIPGQEPAAQPEPDTATAGDGEPDAGAPAAAAMPRPVLVSLEIGPVPGVRLQVEIANEAQAVFFSTRARDEGEGLKIRNVALRPGETTFFLTVKSAWIGTGKDARRGYAPESPYTLTVTQEQGAADGNAELESNDEPAKATPFTAPGAIGGYFSPKGDLDYFALRADQPSLLKVELSGVDRIDSSLSLVRAAGDGQEKEQTLLRANDGAVREGELLVNVAATPGETLYLKVEAAARQVDGKWVRDQENPSEPYSVTVTARADEGFDEREPNDEAARATPVEFGRPLRGLIHPKRDVDYYRLDLSGSPVKVPVKATATGILKVDVALGLYRLGADGKPSLVQSAEKGKGEQAETIRFTVDPGVYLLEVKDTKNWASNFLDSYQLLVERDQ